MYRNVVHGPPSACKKGFTQKTKTPAPYIGTIEWREAYQRYASRHRAIRPYSAMRFCMASDSFLEDHAVFIKADDGHAAIFNDYGLAICVCKLNILEDRTRQIGFVHAGYAV